MAYLTLNLHDLKPVVQLEPQFRHGHAISIQLSPTVRLAMSVADAAQLADDLKRALQQLSEIPAPDPILRNNEDLVSEHASLGRAA